MLARKQDRARVYERLAETASVNLDPRSTWMLFRLDGHPRLDLPALDAALDVTPGQLSTLLAPLVGAGFVTITPSPPESPLIAQLTPAGADAIERLVRARQQGLTRLLGSWSADLDAQLAARIQQLTRDILDDPARRRPAPRRPGTRAHRDSLSPDLPLRPRSSCRPSGRSLARRRCGSESVQSRDRRAHGSGLGGLYDGGQRADQPSESLDGPGFAGDVDAGVDPAKMRAVRAWVVAVMVTSARAGRAPGEAPTVSDHWWPSFSTR